MVHFLIYINIFIFKHQRQTSIGPFLKIYQQFYFQTPEVDVNWTISKDISAFLFTNTRGWHKYVNFWRLAHTVMFTLKIFLKIYQNFYFQTRVADLNQSIFKDISTFLLSNSRCWCKLVRFWYISFFIFKHLRLT